VLVAIALAALLAAPLPRVAAAAEPRSVAEGPGRIRRHDVSVVIDPAAHTLSGQDRLTLGGGAGGAGGGAGDETLAFLLHKGLEVKRVSVGGRAVRFNRVAEHGTLAAWRGEIPAGATQAVVDYAGTIYDPPRHGATSRHGLATDTEGIIGPEGLFLPQAAAFRPWQADEKLSGISVAAETPAGYEAVSGGRLASRETAAGHTKVVWEAGEEGATFLLGGPLKLITEDAPGGVPLYLYFYPEDADLAPAYAAKLREVLPLYTGLLGPYPFAKFAVVENFFPTGLGFPSLTLLGKQVVRLPYVLGGSLAHEFVHSWWGESVEPSGGNWDEALTAYLSDYLLVERQGPAEATAERRRLLERFSTYYPRIEDLPLASFGRPGDRIQDVLGYTKGALVFYELRREVGEDAFFKALRLAAQCFKNGEASWGDLQACFEETLGKKLGWFFKQWVAEPGAPVLAIAGGRVERSADGSFRTVIALSQEPGGVSGKESGRLWRLRVPVALVLADGSRLAKEIILEGKEAAVSFTSKAEPRHMIVDPAAQVLRRLASDEISARLDRFFAAADRVYALPRGPLADAAKKAAEGLASAEPGRIVDGKHLKPSALPEAVMFMGELPRGLAGRFPGAPKPSGEGFSFRGQSYPKEASAVMVASDPLRPSRVLALIYSRTPEGLEEAARLVPHLGRYGWAVFEPGKRPAKGEPEAAGWLSLDLAAPAAERP
jgi:murein DD-endopeptidase MepM/ murein hydrolase activator NlpD